MASSRTSTGGFRRIVRAIAIRCFSPPEKRYPRSPTIVSYPSGSVAISSWIWAACAASSISSSVASGSGEAEVLPHSRVEEIRLLRDDADRRSQRLEGQAPNVRAVDRDGALARVVEPGDEVRARRLARAGLPDERGLRPRRHLEGDVLERPRRVVVAKPDGVELDLAARCRERLGALDDVDPLVQVLEDAVEERERALHLDLHAEQASDREEEPGLQCGEGDERPDRDRG